MTLALSLIDCQNDENMNAREQQLGLLLVQGFLRARPSVNRLVIWKSSAFVSLCL